MPQTRTLARTLVCIALGGAVLVGPPPAVSPSLAADPKEVSKDIIAVQLRKQGFECKNPQSATRDAEASKPDGEVWTLQCEGVTYRVELVPKQAARVERLADSQKALETRQAPKN
jgi:hypothetical protein